MHADRKNSDGEAAYKPSRSSSQAATLYQNFQAYHNHAKQRPVHIKRTYLMKFDFIEF